MIGFSTVPLRPSESKGLKGSKIYWGHKNTFGTAAGLDMATDEHSVPTFCMSVTDAVQAGIIQSADDSGRDHVHAPIETGRYERQITVFHDVFKFKRLGIPSFSQSGMDETRLGVLMSLAQHSFDSEGVCSAEAISAVMKGAKPREVSQHFTGPLGLAINLKMAMLVFYVSLLLPLLLSQFFFLLLLRDPKAVQKKLLSIGFDIVTMTVIAVLMLVELLTLFALKQERLRAHDPRPISALLGGGWSEKVGWRPLFLWGAVLVALGNFASGFVETPLPYIAARACAGAGYGLINLAGQVFVVAHSSSSDRCTNLAGMVAGLYAGLLCGSAFGGFALPILYPGVTP